MATSQATNLLTPVRSEKLYCKETMLLHGVSCQKNSSPRKIHSLWCSEGTGKHILVLGGEKHHATFHSLRKESLKVTGKREAIQ